MDFDQIPPSDLATLIIIGSDHPRIEDDPNLSSNDRAQLIFDQFLNLMNKNLPDPEIDTQLHFYFGVPLSIIDLYLASKYEGDLDFIYTPDQISSLTPEEIESFAQVFNFNPKLVGLEQNRERVYRILKYLGLIFEEVQQTLLEPTIKQGLCSKLSIEDLNNFRLVNDLEELTCDFKIEDPDDIITSYNILNDQTYKILGDIEDHGSINLLLDASADGDYNRVKFYLDLGMDSNAYYMDYFNMQASQVYLNENEFYLSLSPLMNAASAGSLETVQLLVDRKAIINIENAAGMTPLIRALPHPDIVEYLIKNGANPNEGLLYIPLGVAVHNGFYETVKVLLENNANPNLLVRPTTALQLAKDKGYQDIADLLLKYGAEE